MVDLLPEFRRRPLLPPQPGPPGDPLAAWSREAKRALLYPLRPRTAFFLFVGAVMWTLTPIPGTIPGTPYLTVHVASTGKRYAVRFPVANRRQWGCHD